MRIDKDWLEARLRAFNQIAQAEEPNKPTIDLEARNVDEDAYEEFLHKVLDKAMAVEIEPDLDKLWARLQSEDVAIGDLRVWVVGRTMFAIGFDIGYAAAMAQDTELKEEDG